MVPHYGKYMGNTNWIKLGEDGCGVGSGRIKQSSQGWIWSAGITCVCEALKVFKILYWIKKFQGKELYQMKVHKY